MPIDPKGRERPGYERHVFICGHERPEGASRPSCKKRGSLELLSVVKSEGREQGCKTFESKNLVALISVKMELLVSFILKEHGIDCRRILTSSH